jgi:hypothetical protein
LGAVFEHDPSLGEVLADAVGFGKVPAHPRGVAGGDRGLDLGGQRLVVRREEAQHRVDPAQPRRGGRRALRVEGAVVDRGVDLPQEREERSKSATNRSVRAPAANAPGFCAPLPATSSIRNAADRTRSAAAAAAARASQVKFSLRRYGIDSSR